MSIEAVAHELYGLAPEDFTAARNARAKEIKSAGDRALAAAVQALRKPTTGAWLLNQLVRRRPDVLTQVLDLGTQLRGAQGTVSADELRALDRRRRELTQAVAEQAVALGRQSGRKVTGQVTDLVAETLRSAMVDATAGATLATGLMIDTFSASGIEPVELSEAVALPYAAQLAAPVALLTAHHPTTQPDPERQRRAEEAQAALAEAEATLDAAEATLTSARARARQADAQLTTARREREELESERADVQSRLHALDEQLVSALAAQDAAGAMKKQAAREESAAAEGAQAAERVRDGLRS